MDRLTPERPGAGPDRTANLLGALSLVIADRVADAITVIDGHSTSAATTLSALYHFLDRPSIDLLRQVLGLTSSGTVRLIDRLEVAGYVTRGPGRDGRTTTVALTSEGRRVAEQVSAARATVLSKTLEAMSPDDRTRLDSIASQLLVGMIRAPGATRWICRVCDTQACGRDDGRCPVANAAKQGKGITRLDSSCLPPAAVTDILPPSPGDVPEVGP